MRVIIAGSRNFNDYNFLKQQCISIFWELNKKKYNTKRENIEIISGTAQGADKLGETFAKEYNLKLNQFPANWNKYGKSAGYRRNIDMAKYAKHDFELGVLIAFWDGISRGTKHMIDIAKKENLKVFIIKF